MKRIIAFMLAVLLMVGMLAGCGGSSNDSGKKADHVTTEELSLKMMDTLAGYMPQISESAKYEFKELTATWGDVPIHFLFIVKERGGVNEGSLTFDMWNLFVMDLDDGNVYHVKNNNYWETMSPGKAEASNQAIWGYEMFCTGQTTYLIDENEVWTDIVTEEDFVALRQRSNVKLPEARNLLTVEKAEMVTVTHTKKIPDMHLLYVQVRNHAAPMEVYQQEWYAIDLDRGNVYDSYALELSHYDAISPNAAGYLEDVRNRYSSRIYNGYISTPEYEVWNTMFEEHIVQLNGQILTAPVPQPLKPVPQNITTYEIEGFSEYQNQLASLLNWFGMEGVSALSAMEYKGTIPEIDGGEYHLLFLSTDAPKGFHAEDDLVIDLKTGYFYDYFRVDTGYPPLRYCEGIGMLLEGYSAFRDGQQSYIWSKNEERRELLTPEECDKLNEAAQFVESPEITEEEILQEEMPVDENEEVIFEEENTEEFTPEETMEEIFEEENGGDEIIEEEITGETLPPLTLAEEHIQKIIDVVNTYRQKDNWADVTVTNAMLYKLTMDDLGHSYDLLLIGTDNFSDYPLEGILALDLNTGKIWDNETAVWPQGESFSDYEEAKTVLIGGYAEYILGNGHQIWTEMEQSLELSPSQINTINNALQG